MGGSTKKAAAAAEATVTSETDGTPAPDDAPDAAPTPAPAPAAPAAAAPAVAAVPLSELEMPREILQGCVADLESYNFNVHDLNPNLWMAVAERARRALDILTQRIAAAEASAHG